MSKADTLAKLVSTGGPMVDGAVAVSDISGLQTTLDGKLALGGGTLTGNVTFAAGQTWPTFNQNTTGSAASSDLYANNASNVAVLAYEAANTAVTSGQANVGAGLITVTSAYQANVGAGLISTKSAYEANVGAGLITTTAAYQANVGSARIEVLGRADSAFGQANLAYTAANTAVTSGQANTGAGLITTTAAYQANVGSARIEILGRANSAFGQANLAYTAANTAVTTGQANVGAGLITTTAAYQANTGAGLLTRLPLAGGTMTGAITFAAGQTWPTFNQSTTGNAANATTAGGLAIHTGRNNEANKIVRTDANGYIQAGWINSDSGDSGFATRLTRITCSNDNYLRYLGLTDFKVSMGLSAKNNYSRRIDYTSDANYHVGSFGNNTYGANETFHGGSGFFDIWSGTNYPGSFSHIHGINMLHYTTNSLGSTGGNAYGWQMATQYDSDAGPYFRRVNGGSFSGWRKMWHDGNDGSGSGLDADLLDGIDSASFFQNNQDRTLQILRFYGVGGDSGVANQSYAIYQEGGAWSNPFPDLAIGYHTGIKIGGYYGYNGTRIYNNADFATQIASFGDGDNNFRSYYNIIAYASDKRLKENVVNIDNALQKVMKLNGVTFDWKKEVTDLGFTPTAWHECGVLAQEVEAVLPEAVEIAPFDYDWKSEDGSHSKSGKKYLTVKYEKLVPLLIEAMKEQQSQIEAQQKQIDQLMNLVKEITK